MNVYLIRHTSVCVPKGITYGFTDVPLNDTFEEEACRTKSRLKSLSFDKVFSSPASRCRRLAAYCGFPNPILDSRLRELNFGDWEMKSWDEIYADPRSRQWFDNWITTPTPNGESLFGQFERVSSFLAELKEQDFHSVGIFAHGGILTCARVYAGEYELKDAFKQIPAYGEMIRIVI